MSHEELISSAVTELNRPQWKRNLDNFSTGGGKLYAGDFVGEETAPFVDDGKYEEGTILYKEIDDGWDGGGQPEYLWPYGYTEDFDEYIWGGALLKEAVRIRRKHDKNGKIIKEKHPAVVAKTVKAKSATADPEPTNYYFYTTGYQIKPSTVIVSLAGGKTLTDDGFGHLIDATSTVWGEISYEHGYGIIFAPDVVVSAEIAYTAFAGEYIPALLKGAKNAKATFEGRENGGIYFGWYGAMYPHGVLNHYADVSADEKYVEICKSGNLIADQLIEIPETIAVEDDEWTLMRLREIGIQTV